MTASGTYSVLIRTFNSSATLARTVRSLQEQDIKPGQFVIVVSGSTDDCLRAVAPIADINIIASVA